MDTELQTKVFDPFFTTKGVGEGTGLGLSMAHGFVEQAGGRIKLASRLGHGTEIKIYLPRSFESPIPVVVNKELLANLQGDGRHVLLVEDEPGLREILSINLSSFGYVVDSADSANQALELIESNTSYDLLVTDIRLPKGMNGCELAALAVKKQPGLATVFMSGFSEEELLSNVSGLDKFVFLQKPFVKEALGKTLSEALNT